MGVDVFVRKAIMLKEFDCGGNLTTFTEEKEITVKTSGNVLQINKILLNLIEVFRTREGNHRHGFCPSYAELS